MCIKEDNMVKDIEENIVYICYSHHSVGINSMYIY